jgi:hypothetical protein
MDPCPGCDHAVIDPLETLTGKQPTSNPLAVRSETAGRPGATSGPPTPFSVDDRPFATDLSPKRRANTAE